MRTGASIEAVWGLGEGLVSGRYTPDHYEINNETGEFLSYEAVRQTKKLIAHYTGVPSQHSVGWATRDSHKLSQAEAAELAATGKELEKHFGEPLDIEWAVSYNQLYILQARPITTTAKEATEQLANQVLLKGSAASYGLGTGPVKVIVSKEADILSYINEGDVLVTDMTTPDFVPVFSKLSGLITDLGGSTCHAAIVSREYGLPCVVGTQFATSKLDPHQRVIVDGSNGLVYAE